jgi:hypothetical protein
MSRRNLNLPVKYRFGLHLEPAYYHPHHASTTLLRLVKNISQVTLPAVLTVVHGSHEDTSSAFLGRALPPQSLNLSVSIDLVVLEHGQLGLLALVLDLLWCGVDLLLALLGTAAKSEDEMESRLLLDVVVGQGATILELLAGKYQTLLVRRNSFLVCTATVSHGQGNSQPPCRRTLDLALDIVNGVGGLDLKGDGLAREGLYKDLHVEDLDSRRRLVSPSLLDRKLVNFANNGED